MNHEEEMIVISEDEMAEFIQDKLFAEGIAVSKEDIAKVLQYEIDFLELKGVIKYEEE